MVNGIGTLFTRKSFNYFVNFHGQNQDDNEIVLNEKTQSEERSFAFQNLKD